MNGCYSRPFYCIQRIKIYINVACVTSAIFIFLQKSNKQISFITNYIYYEGTVLGPVLFLILMSDISKDINCNIISFADDTRLYSAINSPADCDSLQCDLSNVYKWAESNNMKFNSKKFQYINFTVSPQCNTSNVYVSADSNLIEPSHTVKDLGVLMSNDCMFDDHICLW